LELRKAGMKPVQDTFTEHFFRRMDPEVRDGLTPRQRDAITDALRQSGPRAHSVDLRFTLNLFFTRVYVVLLGGRDLRRKSIEESGRARAGARRVTLSLLLSMAVCAPLLLVLLVLLYLLKCRMGIDLFEDKHLVDFLR
jgi:hypothetical protein